MSESLEILALRKQVLQARSTLCRLRIRHELRAMQDNRLARSVAFVARLLPLAPFASIAINLLRKRLTGK